MISGVFLLLGQHREISEENHTDRLGCRQQVPYCTLSRLDCPCGVLDDGELYDLLFEVVHGFHRFILFLVDGCRCGG